MLNYTDDEERKVAIIKAAHSEFSKSGYAAASIAQIARDAHVSTATIYRLIGGKNELFAAAIGDAVIDLEAWLATEPGLAKPIENLRELLRTYCVYTSQPMFRGVTRAFIGEVGRETESSSGQGKWARGLVRNKFATFIKVCVDAGDFEPHDLEAMSYFAVALIFDACLVQGLFEGDSYVPPLTPEAHAAQTIEWMKRAFGPRKG